VEYCFDRWRRNLNPRLSRILFTPVPALLAAGWGTVVLPFIVIIMLWQFVNLIVGIRRFYYPDQTRGIRPRAIAAAAALMVYVLNRYSLPAFRRWARRSRCD
jgi:hypothetical protein